MILVTRHPYCLLLKSYFQLDQIIESASVIPKRRLLSSWASTLPFSILSFNCTFCTGSINDAFCINFDYSREIKDRRGGCEHKDYLLEDGDDQAICRNLNYKYLNILYKPIHQFLNQTSLLCSATCIASSIAERILVVWLKSVKKDPEFESWNNSHHHQRGFQRVRISNKSKRESNIMKDAEKQEVFSQQEVAQGNTWFKNAYKSVKSRNAIYSLLSYNAVCGIIAMNVVVALLSFNAGFSILSINSFFGILSINCAFCIGCINKSFCISFDWYWKGSPPEIARNRKQANRVSLTFQCAQ